MKQLKDLYLDVLTNGKSRLTRTGETLSVWDRKLEFDLEQGFPAVTSKTLQWNAVVGELLWFLSGSCYLEDLQWATYGSFDDKWTIWSDDAERWNNKHGRVDMGFVGRLYGYQWRNLNNGFMAIDQISNLIDKINTTPNERDLIVMAWNPAHIAADEMCLKPCHLGFQCYVDDGKLNLKWWQRSVDSFLGLPFNIASYALLTHLLANWTGLKVGKLSCDLGDVHIYMNHLQAVNEYLSNPEYSLPKLVLPEQAICLNSTLALTALNFKNSLQGYQSAGKISAPLSVGI